VQFSVTFRVLGLLLMLFSLTMLPPIGVSLWYDDGNLVPFVDTLVFTLLSGALLWIPFRHAHQELRVRDGFLIVALFWTVLSAFGAIPFVLSPALSANVADAFFEAVSGLTTSGGSAFSGLDYLPESLRYYRMQLHLLGGGGIIVLAVAILPMLGVGGMQLYKAEASGPGRDNKLTPRIADTAKALWYIYVGLIVLCATAYWWAGMSTFDAIGHAFSTVATGGFSTHDASIGYFNSPTIEAITILFMWLGALNFSLHFLAWRRGSPMVYLRDPEVRFFTTTLLVVTALVTLGLVAAAAYPDALQALRYGAFQTISLITSTGYLTADFAQWPGYIPWLLLFAFFLGGCAGSTTGGIKAIRFMLLIKQSMREFYRLIHPNGIFVVKFGKEVVSDKVIEAVWGFVSIYVAVTVVLTLLVMATGVSFDLAFSGVVASINNTGPGLGALSSNVSGLNDTAVWLLSFAMLVGRLEVFTVLILFTPMFWRR
jgi:trk system potassium uptake protein TrkH